MGEVRVGAGRLCWDVGLMQWCGGKRVWLCLWGSPRGGTDGETCQVTLKVFQWVVISWWGLLGCAECPADYSLPRAVSHSEEPGQQE